VERVLPRGSTLLHRTRRHGCQYGCRYAPSYCFDTPYRQAQAEFRGHFSRIRIRLRQIPAATNYCCWLFLFVPACAGRCRVKRGRGWFVPRDRRPAGRPVPRSGPCPLRGRPAGRTASQPSKEGNDRSRVALGPRSTAGRLRVRVVSCVHLMEFRRPTSCRGARGSPIGRRVGIRIVTFEACSGFTRVTAHRIAQPPKATFVTRL
jgi:hypothetical protein